MIQNHDLTNIKDIHIDLDAAYVDRLISFIDQTKNPFCFMCDGITVTVNYTADGKTLKETLAEHFSKFKV